MATEHRFLIAVALAAWSLAGCSKSTSPSGNSQTHWLTACDSDADCGAELSCLCDVCVATCSASDACDVTGRVTSCMGTDAPSVAAVCGASAPSMLCLEACAGDAACGAGQHCVGGACVPDEQPVAGAGGAGGGGSGGGAAGGGGSAGGGACVAEGDACEVGGDGVDPCCAGTACGSTVCDPSDPPRCSGVCEASSGSGGTAGGGTGGGGGASGSGGAGGTGGGGDECPGNIAIPAICQVCDDGSCGTPVCSGGAFVGFECPTGGGGGTLAWYATCGDPVCGPPTPVPPDQACTDQVDGAPCTTEGQSCLSGQCGGGFVCASSDPKANPGGCPISRARYKSDIRYVDDATRRAYAEELMSLPLATYRYTADPDAQTQLGFILEDVEPSASVDAPRDRVNLYGYTSMAVAAIQEQSRQIEALGRELELLRGYVAELENQCR